MCIEHDSLTCRHKKKWVDMLLKSINQSLPTERNLNIQFKSKIVFLCKIFNNEIVLKITKINEEKFFSIKFFFLK